jgi:hypothetical protein
MMSFFFRDTGLSAIIDNQISIKTVRGNIFQETYIKQPTTTLTFFYIYAIKGKQLSVYIFSVRHEVY